MDFEYVFNSFREGITQLEGLEDHQLKAFQIINQEYHIFFKDVQSHRLADRKHGGEDVYERMNTVLNMDFPNNKNFRFESDYDFYKFREYLTEGNRQYNIRVIAKLTKEMKAKKQIENYNIYNEQRKNKCDYKCTACDPPIYTNSSSVWEAHIITSSHIKNVDGDPRQYTCDACGEEFENTKKRDRHVENLKCFQLRTCNDCGATLSAKQKYLDHFVQGICNVTLKRWMRETNFNELKSKNKI